MSFLNRFALAAARQTINSTYLKPYGSLTTLEIDPQAKSLRATLELKGETQPLEIQVLNYQLVQQGNDTLLELGEILTSREWLNTLLREHLLEKVIKPRLRQTPLPPMVTMML